MFFIKKFKGNFLFILSCLLLLSVVYGCNKKEDNGSGHSQNIARGERPTEHNQPPAMQPPIQPGSISGVVINTMNSGGYTYVEVESKDGIKTWAAGPQMEIKVGTSIVIPPGSIMQNFMSKSLDRTFETIHFVGSFSIAGAGAGPNTAAAPSSAHGYTQQAPSVTDVHSSAQKTEPGETIEPGSISKVEGGHTSGELFSKRESFNGKNVKIRGKVIKFNSGIMGKNWVHLKDGTEVEGQKDITITTQQVVEQGTIVVAEGKVSADKDVGGGYFYPLLIEDASFKKE